MLASELAAALTSRGITAEAARQRVSRSREPIRRLRRIRFPHNERFVFLEKHDKTPEFFQAFLAAGQKTGSAHGHCLQVLMARGGLCPESLFKVLTGCPLVPGKHLSAERIQRDLLDLGAISTMSMSGNIGPCIELNESLQPSIGLEVMRANLVAEGVALGALREWLKRLNLVSFDKARIRGESPEFAGFRFDLVGPSYVRPLASSTNDGVQPGFVVADIHLGTEFGLPALGYFFRKTRILRSAGHTRPFISLLMCDQFAGDAWKAGRSDGIILATPSAIFGKDIAMALRDLVGVLVNAASAVVNDPDTVYELFSRLSAIEGAAGNLRGPLFELITAHLVAAHSGGHVDIGKVVTSSKLGRIAEIDQELPKRRRGVAQRSHK